MNSFRRTAALFAAALAAASAHGATSSERYADAKAAEARVQAVQAANELVVSATNGIPALIAASRERAFTDATNHVGRVDAAVLAAANAASTARTAAEQAYAKATNALERAVAAQSGLAGEATVRESGVGAATAKAESALLAATAAQSTADAAKTNADLALEGLATKQNALVAGDNITINGTRISANVSDSYLPVVGGTLSGSLSFETYGTGIGSDEYGWLAYISDGKWKIPQLSSYADREEARASFVSSTNGFDDISCDYNPIAYLGTHRGVTLGFSSMRYYLAYRPSRPDYMAMPAALGIMRVSKGTLPGTTTNFTAYATESSVSTYVDAVTEELAESVSETYATKESVEEGLYGKMNKSGGKYSGVFEMTGAWVHEGGILGWYAAETWDDFCLGSANKETMSIVRGQTLPQYLASQYYAKSHVDALSARVDSHHLDSMYTMTSATAYAARTNSVQYIDLTGIGTLTISPPPAVQGRVRDWLVYVFAEADKTDALTFGNFTALLAADASATNKALKAGVTMFAFSEIASGRFVVGRQELTDVTPAQ